MNDNDINNNTQGTDNNSREANNNTPSPFSYFSSDTDDRSSGNAASDAPSETSFSAQPSEGDANTPSEAVVQNEEAASGGESDYYSQPGFSQEDSYYAQTPYSAAQNSGEAAGGYYPYADRSSETGEKRKKPKEKNPQRRKNVLRAALVLVLCVVLSGVTGTVSSILVYNFYPVLTKNKDSEITTSNDGVLNETVTQSPAEDETLAGTTQPAASEGTPDNDSEATTENSQSIISTSAQLSSTEIYKNTVGSVVIVKATIQSTVSSFFGNYTQSGTSTGSGFFITSDGYVLTNYHVIDGGSDITVTTYDGTEYKATVTGYEANNDIAVLKINATVNALTLGDSSALSVGDSLVVIGNALGELSFTLTTGVVSYLSRAITSDSGTAINMFQTNAAINEGNSGGPVLNMNGEVVGIASAKYASSSIEGLGFCIPVDDIKSMVSDIISYGYVTGKPSAGVSVQTISSAMSMRYSIPTGCYVVAVGSGTAADKAGIEAADVITYIGTTRISSCEELSSTLSSYKAGDTVSVTLTRSSSSKTVSVTLDEYTPAAARTEYTNVYDY